VKSCQRTFFCLLASVMMLGSSTVLAEVAIQYHCAGGASLAGDTRLTNLQKVLVLPTTTDLEEYALGRISSEITNRWRLGHHPSSDSLLEPLLGDVFKAESLGRFGGAAGEALSFILALRLEAPRAQLWQETFTKIFGDSGESFASQEFRGQRWNAGGSDSIWMIPAQDWLLIGRGEDFPTEQAQYLRQIKALGRPVPELKQNWLEADIDSARLGGWLRLLRPAHISLAVTTQEDDLQISARVLEAEAIPWKSEPWQLPTNLMRGQIIGFTAGQNVAAFLHLNPALAHLPCNPLTNQFCFWVGDQMPFLNYMAWPTAKASNALQRLAAEAPAALNPALKRFNGTELDWHPEVGRLVLRNIQMLTPVLQALEDKDGQFLFLSCFPVSLKSKPAPEALLAQVQGRTNLVYYDWELTGRRLSEWRILGKMIANRAGGQNSHAVAAVSLADQWIGDLAGLTGNTVTEITRVAPNELSVQRKAPFGFTAVELVLLADWFCNANSGPIHAPPATDKTAPFPAHP
jgi:hypothetical protein